MEAAILYYITGTKATPPSLGSPMEIILLTLITNEGYVKNVCDILNQDLQFMLQINECYELITDIVHEVGTNCPSLSCCLSFHLLFLYPSILSTEE